jgi:drug/metabolite transporter (DMT)-like permease
MSRLIGLVYLIVGVFVAATRDYLDNINGLMGVLSLILAVLLWPLVLLGVDLHLGKEKKGKEGLAMAALVLPYVTARLDELGRRVRAIGG